MVAELPTVGNRRINSMKKIAVIYKSKYGSTKKYAEWIAEETGAKVFEASEIQPERLKEFDLVVYGGGLYAGGINGVKLVTKNECKRLAVFTVGLADPAITDYSEHLNNQFSKERQLEIKFFHLRGGVDYKKLNMVHKGLMALVKSQSQKKPIEQQTSEDKGILETYGGVVDFTDKAAITSIVEFVNGLK